MRKIVHLSDIHFGRVNHEVIQPLVQSVWRHAPDAVVISGDLTQRARTREFLEARAFIDSLPAPRIVVPGNHDISMHNVFHRFVRPLKKFQRLITADLQPIFSDDEMMILGLNTARSLTVKSGRVNHDQIAWVGEQFSAAPDPVTKVLVTHHPFDGTDIKESHIVGRARLAMDTLADSGADLLLSGHLHVGQTTHTALRYNTGARSALVVQAGTATSSRERGEANSYNLLTIDTDSIVIERHEWRREIRDFAPALREEFQRSDHGWQLIHDPVGP